MEKLSSICECIEKKWESFAYKERLMDSMYLLIFGIYMFFYFADTTMFEIMWPADFIWVLRLLTLMFIIFKLAVQKNAINLKNTLFIIGVMTLFFAIWHRTGYTLLYDTAVLLVGAYRVYYKKILKVYLIVAVPFTVYTIFASQMGIVTNLIYNQHGRIREAFGFIYPTDFAAHIFYMFVAWVLLRELKCTIWELLFMFLAVVLLDAYCDTRCSEITIVALVLGVLFLKFANKSDKNKHIFNNILKVIKVLCMVIPVIAAFAMTILCRFYNPNNAVMNFLNSILSQRLKLGKKIFDYYDVQIWGQYVYMVGNGGTTEKPKDYTFIDCSYINILMRFGILVFCVVLLILWIIMLKNYNNMFILGTLGLICIHSMIEHHLFTFYFNIFIILPLAAYSTKIEKQDVSLKKLFIKNRN